MKNSKKLLSLMLVAAMTVLFVGCGDDDETIIERRVEVRNNNNGFDCNQGMRNFRGNQNDVLFRLDNRCFNQNGLERYYSDYSRGQGYNNVPWDRFGQSRFGQNGQFFTPQQYQGQFNYNSNTNYTGSWMGHQNLSNRFPGFGYGNNWRAGFGYQGASSGQDMYGNDYSNGPGFNFFYEGN